MKKEIFILIGPSSAGKTILKQEILKLNSNISSLITHTTRNPRSGENNGFDYYFESFDNFKNMIKNNQLVEWAEYANNLYGTSRKEIETKLKKYDKIIIVMERNGAIKMKQIYGDTVKIVFIYSDLNTLTDRLAKRNTTEEEFNKRVNNIKNSNELNNIDIADYVIINNKTLEDAISMLKFIMGEIN